jgi:hypothetical protein
MPQSAELQTACALEYDAEAGESQSFPRLEADIPVDAEWVPPQPQTMTEAVKEKLKGKEEKGEGPQPPPDEGQSEIWPKGEKPA